MRAGTPSAGMAVGARVVSIGEFHVAAGASFLIIHGLGSCVALLLHDAAARRSCLGHILLPSPPPDGPGPDRGRFASTAVPAMVEALRQAGSRPEDLEAKIAGGSHMFQYEPAASPPPVGTRNVESTRASLEALAIRVTAADTGGTHGRTVQVNAGTGRMEVRALRIDVKVF